MDRNVFLVDFENVNRLAFTGVTALTETDEVIVLYTKACIKTPKALEDFYLKTKASLTMMYAENGHKNALDFQLSALLGRLSCEEKFKTKYYIIAKDKGYDCLSIFLSRFGIDVIRRESIYAAITGMEDPIATAEVEDEEDEGAEGLSSDERIPLPEDVDEEEELETLEKKAKKKKKDKKKKKEEKEPKAEKPAGEKKKKAGKGGSLVLVGMPRPWGEDAGLLPVDITPAPSQAEPEAAKTATSAQDSSKGPLSPDLALVVQAIKERFCGPYLIYQELAIEAFLYAKAHPEEGKNLMEVAHRYLTQALRVSTKVKKVYNLLKPFLK